MRNKQKYCADMIEITEYILVGQWANERYQDHKKCNKTANNLNTYVNKHDLLFQWNIIAPQFLHSLVQRYCSPPTIQSP